MDIEQATWLAELIQQAITQHEHNPCLTIEVEGNSRQWIQVVPEKETDGEQLGGFVLNFAYRKQKGDPLEVLNKAGVKAPPGTEPLTWEDGGYATIWVRPDVPPVALALFAGNILERITGASEHDEIGVQIEYGF